MQCFWYVSSIKSSHNLVIVFFLTLRGYRCSVLVCGSVGGEHPLDELKSEGREKIPAFKRMLYAFIISSVKKAEGGIKKR